MRAGTRVVFTLYILIILTICVAICLAVFGFFGTDSIEGLYYGFTASSYKYIWAAAALVMFVIGVCLLFFGIRKKEPSSIILSSQQEGSVGISVKAVEEVSERCLSEIDGIIVQRLLIKNSGDAACAIKLILSVKPEIEIPATSTIVKDQLKDYVEKYTGLNVKGIDIKFVPIKGTQK